VTVYGLHSIAVILEKTEGLDKYQRFLETIVNFDGLLLQVFTPKEEIEIFQVLKRTGLTFDDSYQYQAAKTFDLKVITLDDDFEETAIQNIKPEEI
jgi:predicted nucleic acid-binding protein